MPFDTKSLENFPILTGVYLMKGCDGTVLYVGKAKNLRQRVRQYFLPGGDGREIIPYLIAKIDKIDFIVVSSEKEALLLENTLIKQHQPRYNALLKDDKAYIALKINNKHPWPMVSLVRYKGKPKADGMYFGPYTSAEPARQTLDVLQRLFPLRQCSDQELLRRTRPCILYGMKRCIAPCVGRCTKEEYDNYVSSTIKFLKGQDREVLKELYADMDKASDSLEFEKAGQILQTIQYIEKTLESQKVDKPLGGDADALAIFRQGEEAILTQLVFREGKLTGSRFYNFEKIADDDHELLVSFMLQHYSQLPDLPAEILVPVFLEDAFAVEEILSAYGRSVRILCPQRGEKKALIEMAQANAEAVFKKEKDAQTILENTLLEMQQKLHLSRYPGRIECFDNSNISGDLVVSSLIAFLNGKKDTSRYRKYRIRAAAGSDDYIALKEALDRRYKRAKEEGNLPDLLIVDGGKGHLNVALKVLKDLDIVSMDVIGVAKEQGRHDRGSTAEQIFIPNIKDPIFLKSTSPILFLLQQIRDEAHRSAVSYQRKLRSKKQVKSVLDDIPGIGPTKKKILLNHFGSLKKLLEATENEISSVKGISKANAQAIIQQFKMD